MGTAILIIVIIFLVAVLAGSIFVIGINVKVSAENKVHEKESKEIFDTISDFNATEVHLTKISGSSIGYDSDRKKICLLDSLNHPIVYDYKEILQSELVIDGEIISKHSTSSTLGRALLGGVLAGGVGAIIGGVTSSEKQKEKVRRIDLKLSINDSKNPFYKIDFCDMEVTKGSGLYNFYYEKAERWHGIIATLIRQADDLEKANQKEVSQKGAPESITDELIKLKSLLDSGVLNQAEFQIQKERILNR